MMTPTTTYTWGIAPEVFIRYYLLLAGIAVILAVALRISTGRGRGPASPTGAEEDHSDPELVAFVAGDRSRMFGVALAALRARNQLVGGTSSVQGTGRGTTALEQAVLAGCVQPRSLTALRSDAAVVRALNTVENRSEKAGLVRSDAARRALRLLSLLPLAVVGVGLARIVSSTGAPPRGYLITTMIVLVVIALLLLRVPRLTRRGQRLLSRLRRSQAHLALNRRPAWTTYGASGLAMGVALYGAGALYSYDPAFAGAVGLPLQRANTTAGGSTSTACGSSSGSTCSSSGSSCGGSSGCGGGGGCGS